MMSMNSRGYSFVEMVAAVVIIGLLATAGVVKYNGYVRKSMISNAQSNCSLIAAAIVQTHNSNIDIPASGWATIGITNPSDSKWTYSFQALAPNAALDNNYTVSVTRKTGKFIDIFCFLKPAAPPAERWCVRDTSIEILQCQ